jgi:hypothetical protein
MGLKASGLSQKSSLKSIIGYTDTETVKLDFDDTPFSTVRYWANRAMRWFKLGGFIVLKSSEDCYHVLFDRKVSWVENVKIMAWACLVSKHRKLTGWFILQCIKPGSTLRVSPKGVKPSPRIVYRYGGQDGEITRFLRYRRLIKGIMRKTIGKE